MKKYLIALILLFATTCFASDDYPHLAPDGTYVGDGSPQLAPDGTYVGGRPNLAPNGTYVGGKPQLAPDGSYVLTYTQWNRVTYSVGIATSTDLVHWEKHGPAFFGASGGKLTGLNTSRRGL